MIVSTFLIRRTDPRSNNLPGGESRKKDAFMMAEIIRENSAIYPRPVPIDVFMGPPFDLTQEEVFGCLGRMGQQSEYQDIAKTTTSVGTVFLYSNRHLDPDHASMLAEWLDVGQASNP